MRRRRLDEERANKVDSTDGQWQGQQAAGRAAWSVVVSSGQSREATARTI